ncbi:MAG TPA: heparinase II/III family protein [Verrucomicrobiae bacterium]|nr:heparinase II/III family protein [Verrucomicrobiae bacterium]
MKSALILFGILFAGSAICEDASDAWMKKIRRDHPRMFFNAESWAAVKARALNEEKDRWERDLRTVDRYPDNPVCSGFEAVEFREIQTATGTHKVTAGTPIKSVNEWGPAAARCAIAWRMTGKPEYLEKARKMLEVSIAAYREAYRNRRAVSWYSTTRVLALAAYDWIYDGLTPEQRRALIVPLVEHVDEIQPGPGKPAIVRRNTGGIEGGFYSVRNLLWFSGLAAYGDGFCDELGLKHLKKGYEYNQQLLKFRSDSAADDGGLSSAVNGYCMGAYPWAHFNFMHTSLSATGENPAKDWPQLALFPNWIYWNWIPNLDDAKAPLSFGFGDDQHTNNRLNVGSLYEHMTHYMHFFKEADPRAASLAASLRNLAPNKSLGGSWPMYPYLMTSVDAIKPFAPEELIDSPLRARHFEALGQFVMRSGWKPDSTYCLYTVGARLIQHKHHDENNFVIYKKGYLALDSGTRGIETDYNLRQYYAQTVAHNCILIHKPGETMPAYWGMKYDGPEGDVNHGGMSGYSGKALAFETTPEFTYVAGETTGAYGEKCTEAVRQFIHLQPDYFIVYDRVGAADASYRKEWLLHTQEQPVVNGHVLRADEHQGRLFCETLLPEGARLSLVGGPGKEFWSSGRNWELDQKFLANEMKAAARTGRKPLFGNWRLEVSPASPARDDRFLHVLTACEQSVATPVAARLLKTEAQDGVEITLSGRTVTALFNRTGEVGGSIVIREDTGKRHAQTLANAIQPQAGIDLGAGAAIEK